MLGEERIFINMTNIAKTLFFFFLLQIFRTNFAQHHCSAQHHLFGIADNRRGIISSSSWVSMNGRTYCSAKTCDILSQYASCKEKSGDKTVADCTSQIGIMWGKKTHHLLNL